MAVAKLANSTVNHSQAATEPTNRMSRPPRSRPSMKATVVMTLPTSTTNITGLRATSRGSSLTNERTTAGHIRSRMDALADVWLGPVGLVSTVVSVSGVSTVIVVRL